MHRLVSPALLAASLACGPGGPSGDDEIGGTESETGSGSTTETSSDSDSDSDSDSTETDSGTESDSGSTTETSSDSGSTTETSSDSGSSSETGDPPELCPVEPYGSPGLWALPCGPGCSEVSQVDSHLFRLDADGSQLPQDILVCGNFSFEGTVIDHPSPDTWIIDACPCDMDCAEPDPHIIDFAQDGEHPAPELLPADLSGCVRADVHRSDVFWLETVCAPTAVALWSLEEPEPRLVYAQVNHTNSFQGPEDILELGPLTFTGAGEVCAADNGSETWHEYALRFDLDGAEVVVPPQALDTLVHPSGDYEARNVINTIYFDGFNPEGFDYAMWSLRPL